MQNTYADQLITRVIKIGSVHTMWLADPVNI